MNAKNLWSLAELEKTDWAIEFKADSPVSYLTAIKYAQRSKLRVFVEKSDDSGKPQWVARVFDDPEFWMEAKPTKAGIMKVCRTMGWTVVR